EMVLRPGPGGVECDPALSAKTGGLRYEEMVALAEGASFRIVLSRIGEIVADLFEAALACAPGLRTVGRPKTTRNGATAHAPPAATAVLGERPRRPRAAVRLRRRAAPAGTWRPGGQWPLPVARRR